MKVLHVITSLKQGGAQIVLRDLVQRMRGFESEVIALLPDQTMVPALGAAGAVRVTCIDLRRPDSLLQLRALMRAAKPDLVQTWMHHADLVAGGVARAMRLAPVIWNIRGSRLDLGGAPLLTRMIAKACALTSSRIPRRIVCGSHAAHAAHVALGYDASRMLVIPNGFDVDRFRPDAAMRADVRRELQVGDDTIVIGLFARFDPLKDHRTFLAAAGRIARERPNVRFLLAGDLIDANNARLVEWIREENVAARCILLGRRDDVPRLLNGVDIACLSSFSEGFPNVVGEAMACAIPMVVTDVGDAALLLGDCGEVVPPRDPAAIAAACVRLIDAGADARARLGACGRERIREHFSIDAVVAQYEALYRATVS